MNRHTPDNALTPDQYAEFMANVIAANPDDIDQARIEAVHLSHALLADLGFAEGVLIFNEMGQWYDVDPDTDPWRRP